MKHPPEILRTPEAAEFIGLSVSTLEKLRFYGGGPNYIRLGKRAIGYRIEDLRAWINARPKGKD